VRTVRLAVVTSATAVYAVACKDRTASGRLTSTRGTYECFTVVLAVGIELVKRAETRFFCATMRL